MTPIIGTFGPDSLIGTDFDDILLGLSGDDTISGKKGNDLLFGDKGDDILSGNAGNDILFGGAGSDTLSGNKGVDIVTGGAGADFFVANPNDGTIIVTDFETGVDKLDFRPLGFANIDEAVAAVVFTGVGDGIPGFTGTFPELGVRITILGPDEPLPLSDAIV